jgi:hypothetical protein
MGLTTTSLPDFAAGTLVKASDLRDRFDTIQQYLNGQIAFADLSWAAWVDHTHVISSEFYGAPSRRTVGTSFHAWHRKSIPENLSTDWVVRHSDYSTAVFTTSPDDQAWHSIRDASATIHVPPIDTGGTVGLSIWCNWFAYATATDEGDFDDQDDVENDNNDHIAAAYQLFVDGTPYPETRRYIHASSTMTAGALGGVKAAQRLARKNLSTCLWIPSISPGVHSVALKMLVFDPLRSSSVNTIRNWKHVWVGPRFFEAEIFLL